jgi:signal transduction histidine kinase
LIAEFTDYVTSNFENSTTGSKDVVNLKEFFETVSAEYLVELKSKGIDFKWSYDARALQAAEGDYYLEVDMQRIRRVFANLVSNSLKHANTLRQISFQCLVVKNQVTFSVEDDGPGVPPDELEVIFAKFYRVDKSRSREKGGSGLGLAICKNIIENHGGTIRAYLTEAGGLGIAFSLPAVKFHKA